jgi:DNA-directed RNA polymerase specialized sigma24 family protein
MMGAGPDAEDVVHDALLAAAAYRDLDEQRVWALLANIIAKRIADRYRRTARAQILVRHRALLQRPRWFEHDVVDRAEAVWVAAQLVKILPSEILDLLWLHHVGGASWTVLAAQLEISTQALKQRVSRAVLSARRRIDRLRG